MIFKEISNDFQLWIIYDIRNVIIFKELLDDRNSYLIIHSSNKAKWLYAFYQHFIRITDHTQYIFNEQAKKIEFDTSKNVQDKISLQRNNLDFL